MNLIKKNWFKSAIILVFIASIGAYSIAERQRPIEIESATSAPSDVSTTLPSLKNSELDPLSAPTSTSDNEASSISSNTSNDKPYVPSVETKIIIPFKDKYQLGSDTRFGHIQSIGGIDGYNITYTLDSYGKSPGNSYFPGSDRIIYVGDGGANLAIKYGQRMYTAETYEQLYNRLLPGCDDLVAVARDKDSALQWCKQNIIDPNMILFGF